MISISQKEGDGSITELLLYPFDLPELCDLLRRAIPLAVKEGMEIVMPTRRS